MALVFTGKHTHVVDTAPTSELMLFEFTPDSTCHAVEHWASAFTSLSLSVFTCKMEVVPIEAKMYQVTLNVRMALNLAITMLYTT